MRSMWVIKKPVLTLCWENASLALVWFCCFNVTGLLDQIAFALFNTFYHFFFCSFILCSKENITFYIFMLYIWKLIWVGGKQFMLLIKAFWSKHPVPDHLVYLLVSPWSWSWYERWYWPWSRSLYFSFLQEWNTCEKETRQNSLNKSFFVLDTHFPPSICLVRHIEQGI